MPKAKDTKKSEAKDSPSEDKGSRGQEQKCSRPRTEMLEAKAKDTGASVLHKKIFFRRSQKKIKSSKILLVLELRNRGFYVQAYADDLAVLVIGDDMLWIRGTAQKAINIAANWASEQELQFSNKKTEIVGYCSLTNGIQIWVPCQKLFQT